MIKLLAKIANLFIANKSIEVTRVDQPLPIWRMVSGGFDINDADLVMLSSGYVTEIVIDGSCSYPRIDLERPVNSTVVAYRRRKIKKEKVECVECYGKGREIKRRTKTTYPSGESTVSYEFFDADCRECGGKGYYFKTILENRK